MKADENTSRPNEFKKLVTEFVQPEDFRPLQGNV